MYARNNNLTRAMSIVCIVPVLLSACATEPGAGPNKPAGATGSGTQIGEQLRRLGERLVPVATGGAPQSTARRGAGAPSHDAAASFDPLAPPKRLVGVQGVRLGMPIAETHEFLQQRGWIYVTTPGDGQGGTRALWRKGGLELDLGAEKAGRIDRISFRQVYEPGTGQFHMRLVREELIERFGPPMFDPFGRPGSTIGPASQVKLQWSESPQARSYDSFMAASPEQKQQINLGPRLDADIERARLNMTFSWRGLSAQAAAQASERARAQAASAPARRPALE
ncbi:MAG: hypothetical protein JNJ89_18560 [Rubrivivax sp.]|nr:hypothetical protein [Rubrivivax sp.]